MRILLTWLLAAAGVAGMAQGFPLPAIPDSLQSVAQRSDYAVRHFWDHYDFQDTTLLRQDYAEQAVADYIALLGVADAESCEAGIMLWMSGASGHIRSYTYFYETAEAYLHHRESPVYNDSLFLMVARQVARGPYATLSSRAADVVKRLTANAPGTKASDFEMETGDDRHVRLYDVAGPSDMLLLLYDPDCRDCKDLLFRLRHSSLLKEAIGAGRLKVLAVCIGDDAVLWQDTVAGLPQQWLHAKAVTDLAGKALYNLDALPLMLLLGPDGSVVRNRLDYRELERLLINKT